MDLPQQSGQTDEECGTEVEEERVESGDLWFSVILIILSSAVIIKSFQMPRPGGWLSAPGIFPLFSAVILIGLGTGLLFSTLQKRRLQPSPSTKKKMDQKESRTFVKRMIVAVVGILIYTFVLIPTIHFTMATFIYLVGTLWYFWRGKFYKILIISVVATLFFSEMFKRFFQIILP